MRFALSLGPGRAMSLPRLHCQVRCSNPFFVASERPASLDRAEEEMPGDVHGGVDQGRSEDRPGLAPGPAVEKSGDGGQDHVAPVGKAHVGDVREAEKNRGGPPAGEFAVRSARKHVLKQTTEEKLLWPSGEEQNAE